MTVCDFGHGFKLRIASGSSSRLHNQTARNGHGTAYQPFYRGSSRWPPLGSTNDGPGATFFLSLPIARDTHASFS